MKLKIAWMYYDLLELYGDRGNINVFSHILEDNNIDYTVDEISIHNENIDISNHDIVFLGGGSDQAQRTIEKDLFSRQSQFENVVKNNGFILGICGGYQMMGQYYMDAKGNKTKGLGLFPFYTKAGDKRCVGNIKLKPKCNELKDVTIVGFENHGGQTYDVGENYFGDVIKGQGNSYGDRHEGYLTNNFLGTYVHGPLLPKNPEIGKYIIEKVLDNKYNQKVDIKIKYSDLAKKAKEAVNFENS